jgi:thymidine kinase
MCYGLRSDFQGKAFEGSAALLVLADDVEEMKTICDCGKKASMNARFDDDGNRLHQGDQVLIGGNMRYRALCPDCFYNVSDRLS